MKQKPLRSYVAALKPPRRRIPGAWYGWLPIALLACSKASAADSGTTQTNVDLTAVDLDKLMTMDVQVSSASKFMQKETEAPASVTVVTSEDIKRYGYRTLGDLLQSVSGFNVSYDRNYQYLGDRGISLGDFNSRTLLLVDGHRVNNNLTDGAYIDTAFILDMDLVDRVEIIRGPSAVLYGNNAFFGVINVVTRTAPQINGFEVSGGYGSFETYQGRLTYGQAYKNGINLLLSTTIYDSAGVSKLFYPAYNTPAQNNGVAQNLDGDAYGNAFASLSYGDLTLEGAFNRRVKQNPTAQYDTAFDVPGLTTTDDRGYVNLKLDHEFPDIVDLTANVYYDYSDHLIGQPISLGGQNRFFKETDRGEWCGGELQMKKQVWEKHTITVGTEYRNDFQQEAIVDEPGVGRISDLQKNRQSYGVYGEGDVELLKPLHVNGGVRWDKYGDFDPTVNPRVALIYTPLEQSTFKAIYGTAFRAPNFVELIDFRFQNIKPEDITSYELVYEQGIGKNLRTTVSGFYNEMDDLIVISNGQYRNINARSEGMELGLEGEWAYGIRGRASYTLQHTKDESQSIDLPDSPEHLLKFNLSVPIIKEKLFASLEYQFTSRRSTFSTDAANNPIPGMDAGAYSVVNFTLFSQNIVKNLDVSASIYNLFDQQYSEPATPLHYNLESQIPQNGRTFGVKLTYRF